MFEFLDNYIVPISVLSMVLFAIIAKSKFESGLIKNGMNKEAASDMGKALYWSLVAIGLPVVTILQFLMDST